MTETSEICVCTEPEWFTRFTKLFSDKKYRKIALFTHRYPDPDAVGSIMAMSWLLSKWQGVEADGFYDGPVSHPQNIAMVNLLDPNIHSVKDYKADDYDLRILLDTVPDNAGVGGQTIKFDVVIDHHKESCPSIFDGVFINLKAGSCCGTVFDIIRRLDVSFVEQNDTDARVATAILIGITTDTENLMADDTTDYEFTAWAKLFQFRNPLALRKIVSYDRPRFWIDYKAKALTNYTIDDGVGIVGMGIIPAKHRDMIADMAQDMVSWEGVETAIAFALVDGDRIEGSVRSVSAAVSVPKLCKALGDKYGSGGGKVGKGAYRLDLAGGGITEEEGDSIRSKTWDLQNEKEKARIIRLVRK